MASAADEPAEVALPGDAADEHEGDDEVDPDPGQDAAHVTADLDGDDQQRAHQAEDRARGAVGAAELRPGPVDQRRAGQAGEEVQRQEAGPADRQLELRAEHPQRQHVEADVPDLDVGEHRGDQLPVGAVRDAGHVRAAAGVAGRLGCVSTPAPEVAVAVRAAAPASRRAGCRSRRWPRSRPRPRR